MIRFLLFMFSDEASNCFLSDYQVPRLLNSDLRTALNFKIQRYFYTPPNNPQYPKSETDTPTSQSESQIIFLVV